VKKLINEPGRVVPEMLEGFVAAAPRLAPPADGAGGVRADIGAFPGV